MIALLILLLICAIPMVLGYRLLAREVNVRALNGALLLALGVGMALWLFNNISFGAGL
jgi:hypothetical protein